MKFKGNTAPLKNGVDLCIIDSNISKFFHKSCLVELTIEEDCLRINTEASSLKSELILQGKSSGDGVNNILVDSVLFKKLLNTLDSNVVEIEITENSLHINSGGSKFNLPKMLDSEDAALDRPTPITSVDGQVALGASGWNFIKNHQLYAIAVSFIHPVYTNVWSGESGDTIVGDVDNSIFTYSKKSSLNKKCLITDTIINLLTNVPEEAKIIENEDNYEVFVEIDPYTYLCEFTPKYETDEGVGDYNSDMILPLFKHDDTYITFNKNVILKYINQAELFVNNIDSTVRLILDNNSIIVKNDNANCKLDINNPFGNYEMEFKISFLKDAISHINSDEINMCPLIQEDELIGIILWSDDMTTVLSVID